MPPTAVILIDHGSRQGEAAEALEQIAQLVSQKLRLPVEMAHLAIGQPTLDEAIDRAALRGCRHIVVCPYFLAVGTHSLVDIPAQIAAAAKRHPRVDIQLAQPLGPDPLLADLVVRRLRPLLSRAEGV
jgi:sirohydrochlorin ferrochelatase